MYPQGAFGNMMSIADALAAILSGLLIAAVTFAGRRWGPRVAGLLSGLPVVVGPILVVLAIEHGGSFAGRAASGALFGLLTVPAFVVGFMCASRRLPWPQAVAAGWVPAIAVAYAVGSATVPPVVSLVVVATALAAAAWVTPAAAPAGAVVRGDVAIRAGLTVAVVWASTQVARVAGPELGGMIASLPLLATILVIFTSAGEGPAAATTLLRAMLTGLGSYAALCFVVAASAS